MNSISETTRIVLLLCGIHRGSEAESAKPLGASDFSRLMNFLSKSSKSIESLFDTDARELLAEGIAEHQIEIGRIVQLLDRGMAMAVALEQWQQNGIWIVSPLDESYPKRLKEKLQDKTSPLLFGVGNPKLLNRGGLAVVGSRKAEEAALTFAKRAGELCAKENVSVISGAARGVDLHAMNGALEAGGQAVGILANNLAREATNGEVRSYIEGGKLTLITPFSPEAPFHAGNAMVRNKYIYVLADYALVVSSDYETGGTWSGAVENLKSIWCPLFVRDADDVPEGNRRLLKKEVRSLTESDLQSSQSLFAKLDALPETKSDSEQTSLF